MSRFYIALTVIAGCVWHPVALDRVASDKAFLSQPIQLAGAFSRPKREISEEDKAFLSKPIKVTLKNTDESFETKDGQRTVTGYRVATDLYELRLSLWTLMGEPAALYLFRMPRMSKLVLHADGGYKKSVEIRSIGENKGQEYMELDGDVVRVSQDVLDKIQYYDLAFSIETIDLYPLPNEFYEKGRSFIEDIFSYVTGYPKAYINHLRNPGVLSSPGKWGQDVPGSPSWSEFLSRKSFRQVDNKLPEADYMDEKQAREAFRRMLYAHHVKKRENLFGKTAQEDRALFVKEVNTNNEFKIHHLNFSVNSILHFIRKHDRAAYDHIMENPPDKKVAKKDSETPPDMNADKQVVTEKNKDGGTPLAAEKKEINAPKKKIAWKSDAWDKFAASEKGEKKDGGTSTNSKTAASNSNKQKSSSGHGPSGSLILLIDVSGSMAGTKLSSAKGAAINTIRKALKNKTEIAILTFEGDCTSPIHASIGFSRHESDLVAFVKGLDARGGTPLATALEATNRFMNQNKSASSRTQMILLLADGDDNCGNLDAILSQLKQNNLLYRHETVGLEVSGSAQRQLQNIATQSGGKYHSATSQNLSKVFSDAMDLMKMLDMIGKFR